LVGEISNSTLHATYHLPDSKTDMLKDAPMAGIKYIFNKAYNRFVHMLSLLHQHFSVAADPLYLKNFERKIYLFAIVQKIFYKRRLSYGK